MSTKRDIVFSELIGMRSGGSAVHGIVLAALLGGGKRIITVTGAVARFTAKKAKPVADLTVSIEPVQSGSGDPSPSNVRPISGWTGCSIFREAEYDAEAAPTLSVSWQSEAGTVYGGTLDVTTGVLTVDRAVKTFVGDADEGWSKQSTYNYFICNIISGAVNANSSSKNFKSNKYPYGNITTQNSATGACLIWGCVRVRLADMSISLQDWKASLSAEPLQVLYPLATPATYQLTPAEIQTLVGENNIWADTGDVTVRVYGQPIPEPEESTLSSLNILLGGTYRNNQTQEDVSDEEALEIILGGTK